VRRRVAEMLDIFVHMGHLAARYPAELSGGQQHSAFRPASAARRGSVIQPKGAPAR